jgi:hypothetical protein
LGIERLSLFKNGGNMPISAFLDPDNREMQLWIQYVCPVQYPGFVPSTSPSTIMNLHCDVLAYRQFAGADLVLRTGSKQVMQLVNLRDGFDKWACGELARVNVSTDGGEVEEFGTIMMKEFLILVDPEELSCEEIETALKTSNPLVDSKALLQEIHASVKGDVDKDDGGDLVRVGKFNVYSTARRILEYVGKMTRTELSRNYFTSGTKLG